MKRHRGAVVGVAAACALAFAAAGCGSSDSDSSGAATSGGTQAKSTVNVGVVGSFSGVTSVGQGTPKVMEAWADSVNAAGGINGADVQVIVKDTGSTTGAGRAAVQKLIKDDGVVAIVSQDPEDLQWVKYAEQNSVPVLVAQSGFASVLSPSAFPISATTVAVLYGIVQEAKNVGDKMGIGYASEVSSLSQFVELMKAIGQQVGVTVPVATKMSSTQPDYTALCQQFKGADVAFFYLMFPSAIGEKIADQCIEQGLDAPQVLQAVFAQPTWKSNPSFDGNVVVDGVAPFFDDASPAAKEYREALESAGVAGTKEDVPLGLSAWAAGKMIEAAAAKDNGPVTSASLMSGLHTMKDETLGGLIAPVTYTAGKTTAVPCWFTWKISGGEFVKVNDGKPTCVPQSKIAPLEATVAKSLGG